MDAKSHGHARLSSRYRRLLPIDIGLVRLCKMVLDFDAGGELYESWRAKVAPDLLQYLVVEKTPSGGFHVVYRCAEPVCGNLKLAQRRIEAGPEPVQVASKTYATRRDAAGRWYYTLTLIETRGRGGLILCAPTSGYQLIQGDFADLPTISADDREHLLEAAYSFNECEPEAAPTPAPKPTPAIADGRPGDDYNTRGDVAAVLQRHGWRLFRDGDNQQWTRPGKETGCSATLKDRVFFVHSSSAEPFAAGQGYAPFAHS